MAYVATTTVKLSDGTKLVKGRRVSKKVAERFIKYRWVKEIQNANRTADHTGSTGKETKGAAG